jgi:3-oxoacyl-[acyl-carrier protein] reductase
MNLGLNSKTALVLGGSRGLGRAIAKALAAEGARVAISGRTAETLDVAVKEIEQAGGSAMGLAWDLADLGAIEANVSAVETRFGPINILVNNTGGPPPTTAAGQALDVWKKNFETLVLSLIGITDRVLPKMREQKWGRIITSTSSGVISPIPGLALSNALRASLVGWSKTLSQEVAREGVTVNVLVPGRIATDRLRSVDEGKAKREGRPIEAIQKESLAMIPMGRYGEPAEYGSVAAFLASELASYITGAVIRVDGGLVSSI